MKELIKLNKERRKLVFEIAAREMHVNPIIIEKDFWVCFVLNFLMNESQYKDFEKEPERLLDYLTTQERVVMYWLPIYAKKHNAMSYFPTVHL